MPMLSYNIKPHLFIYLAFFLLSPLQAQQKYSCEQADTLLSMFQFQKAEIALKQCLEIQKDQIPTLIKLAQVSFHLGKKNASKNYNREIIQLDSNNRKARIQLSSILEGEKNYIEAAKQYQYLVKMDSTNSYFHRRLAEITYKMALFNLSEKHFLHALLLNPNDQKSSIDLAKIYQDQREYQKARGVLFDALRQDSSNNAVRFELCKLNYRKKDYEGVVYQMEKILNRGSDTNLLYKKIYGIALFHSKKFSEAIELLLPVVENSNDNEVVHYYLAQCYKNLDETESSKKHFKLAIDDGISKNISNYYSELGAVHEEQGELKEAIKAYKIAYNYSKDKLLLYHLARNYDQYYQDKETAMRYYELYLAENDSSNLPLLNYSASRLSELKQIMHFEIDSLN